VLLCVAGAAQTPTPTPTPGPDVVRVNTELVQTDVMVFDQHKKFVRDDSATIYNSRHPLPPGLYQVRVAARDSKTGHVGSAQQWIQIPDLASHRLTLSSLLLGLQAVAATGGGNAPQVQFSVDHHFARGANLGFMTFVYNADQSQSSPKISYQARISQEWPAIDGEELAEFHAGAGRSHPHHLWRSNSSR